MRADGRGRVRRLTRSRRGAERPAWAPDGRRLVYSGHRHPRLSCRKEPTYRPADGRRVWPGRYEGGSPSTTRRRGSASCQPSISTMRPDGSRIRPIVESGGDPEWSPKGRWIAYTQGRFPCGGSAGPRRPTLACKDEHRPSPCGRQPAARPHRHDGPRARLLARRQVHRLLPLRRCEPPQHGRRHAAARRSNTHDRRDAAQRGGARAPASTKCTRFTRPPGSHSRVVAAGRRRAFPRGG